MTTHLVREILPGYGAALAVVTSDYAALVVLPTTAIAIEGRPADPAAVIGWWREARAGGAVVDVAQDEAGRAASVDFRAGAPK